MTSDTSDHPLGPGMEARRPRRADLEPSSPEHSRLGISSSPRGWRASSADQLGLGARADNPDRQEWAAPGEGRRALAWALLAGVRADPGAGGARSVRSLGAGGWPRNQTVRVLRGIDWVVL